MCGNGSFASYNARCWPFLTHSPEMPTYARIFVALGDTTNTGVFATAGVAVLRVRWACATEGQGTMRAVDQLVFASFRSGAIDGWCLEMRRSEGRHLGFALAQKKSFSSFTKQLGPGPTLCSTSSLCLWRHAFSPLRRAPHLHRASERERETGSATGPLVFQWWHFEGVRLWSSRGLGRLPSKYAKLHSKSELWD